MIYTFKCSCGSVQEVSCSIKDGPPSVVECSSCRCEMQRDWQSDEPTIDTSGCRDHNFIPREKRVLVKGSRSDADRREHQIAQHIKQRRQQLKDGGNQGTIKQSHALPAELYHGKIRETKDRNYWNDKKNLDRHKDFKVGP